MTRWIETGKTETGLRIFVAGDTIDEQKYIRVQYKDKEGNKVGTQQQYNIDNLIMLKGLIDILNMDIGYGWE